MTSARWAAACVAVMLVAGCTGSGHGTLHPSFAGRPVSGCAHSTGRPGQDTDLVPSHPVSLTICSTRTAVPGHSGPARTHDSFGAGQFDHLLAVLGRGRHEPRKIMSCDGGGEARTYTLVFGYRAGPDVTIDVGPDCHPSITNGSVATDNTHAVMIAVDRMIGVRCSDLIC